jgi:hypothetical protein
VLPLLGTGMVLYPARGLTIEQRLSSGTKNSACIHTSASGGNISAPRLWTLYQQECKHSPGCVAPTGAPARRVAA